MAIDIVGVGAHGEELSDNGLLLCEVGFACGLLLGAEGCFLLLYIVEERLGSLFVGIYGGLERFGVISGVDELLSGSGEHVVVALVEELLHAGHLVGRHFGCGGIGKLGQTGHYFGACHWLADLSRG